MLSPFEGICYPDDIQSQDVSKLQILNECLESIKGWMVDNFLQPNEGQTEVLVCAPDRHVPKIMNALGPLSTFVKSSIRNLGVIFDPAHFGCSRQISGSVLLLSLFYHNISKLSLALNWRLLFMQSFYHDWIAVIHCLHR